MANKIISVTTFKCHSLKGTASGQGAQYLYFTLDISEVPNCKQQVLMDLVKIKQIILNSKTRSHYICYKCSKGIVTLSKIIESINTRLRYTVDVAKVNIQLKGVDTAINTASCNCFEQSKK